VARDGWKRDWPRKDFFNSHGAALPAQIADIDTVTASRSFPCRIALRYRLKISKTARKQAKSAEFPCDDGARRIGCSNAAGGSKATICRTLWAFRKETDELKWDDRYV